MRPIRLILSVCAACVIAVAINSGGGASLFPATGATSSGGAKFVSVGQKSDEPGLSLKAVIVDLVQRFHGREKAKQKDLAGLRARRAYEKSNMAGLTADDLTGRSYEQILIDQAAAELRGEERAAARGKKLQYGSVGYLR